ncbi:MAG: hypothetical protein RMM98_00955 [Acidobacteriota bacterium]|nr:hypothetical protein [Blastocatellia bacterium]MDW8238156.1 hypothetical protein [Acidobacteriota bacterium]
MAIVVEWRMWHRGWLALMGALIVAWAQGAQSPSLDHGVGQTEYYYRFESTMMDLSWVEMYFNQTGRGQFIFRRKNDEEPIRLDLSLLPETVHQIDGYVAQMQFLTSQENYQSKRDLSHLGTITWRVRQGERQRQVSFNHTQHPVMRELANLLRHITTQETRLFTLQLVRQYEPLGLDKELMALQREINNGWIAEPVKFVPLLHDLQSDENILLIARRRAGEILQRIKKHLHAKRLGLVFLHALY